MKFCAKCGQQLPDQAAFCSKCGTPQKESFHNNDTFLQSKPHDVTQNSGIKSEHHVSDQLKLLLVIPATVAIVVGIISTPYGATAGLISTLLGLLILIFPYRLLKNRDFHWAFISSLLLGAFYAASALLVLLRGDLLDTFMSGAIAACLLYVANKVRLDFLKS